MKRFRSIQFSQFVVFLTLFLAACGGGGGDPTPGTNNQPPIMATSAAGNVGTTTATLNGTANPNGNATTAWFEWSADPTLVTYSSTTSQSVGSGVTAVAVNADLSGLASGTTYYYRVCGSSVAGSSKGSIASFTTGTPAAPPTVQTLGATDITTDAATLNGSVNPNSVATDWWFEFGTDPSLANYDLTAPFGAGSGSVSIAVSRTIGALATGTTYYYRVCAWSSAGTSKGSIASFTTGTPAAPPTIQTLGATDITTNAATANGTANPNGNATTAWFEWSADPTLVTYSSTTSQSVGSGVTAVAVNADLSGLASGTTYYYRVCGSSVAGSSKGSIASFTTGIIQTVAAPTFNPAPGTYPSAQNVTLSTATAGASIKFTTDGSTPSATNGTVYSAPIPVSSTTTIRAYAYLAGWNDSPVASGTYTITPPSTVTITGNPHPMDSYLVFYNNQQVSQADGTAFNYQGVPGDYKFFDLNGLLVAAARPYSIVDASGNNVFRLSAGGALDLGYPNSGTNGRVSFSISGSGFTPLYQAPINVGSAPAWTVTTVATDNNYPVVSPSVVIATYFQTENRVTFNDPYLGTVYGTMNGDLLLFYAYAFNGSEIVQYRETVVVNAAGNYFYGDVEINFLGTGRYVRGAVTGSR